MAELSAVEKALAAEFEAIRKRRGWTQEKALQRKSGQDTACPSCGRH